MDKPYLGGTEGVSGPMCLGGGAWRRAWADLGAGSRQWGWEKASRGQTAERGIERPLNGHRGPLLCLLLTLQEAVAGLLLRSRPRHSDPRGFIWSFMAGTHLG